MDYRMHPMLLAAPVDDEREPLAEVVRDVEPVFELAESSVFLANPTLHTDPEHMIVRGRSTRASVYPQALPEDHLVEVLHEATSRVYDGAAVVPEDERGDRHTLLIPIEPTDAGPDAVVGFLVVEGRPEVVELVRQCARRPRARGAAG